MSPKSNLPYKPISQDENDQIAEPPPKPLQYDKTRLIWPVFGLFLFLTIATTVILALLSRSHRPTWESCGSDPATARARGCTFDLISFAWQTPECYDASLVADFADWETWTYYTEEGGERSNTTVAQEVVLLGEQNMWITWHFHLVHCTFIWRQMHRAFERGWIDSHADNYNHTKHCQKALLRGTGYDEDFTRAPVIYPVCRQLEKRGGVGLWDSLYSS
jgi:hypothetical protein